MDRPDLFAEPRYARASDRAALRDELKAILEPVFREKPRDHWTALFAGAGIPCGAIKSVGEVCEANQLAVRGVARSMQHPTAGDLRYLASAVRFDDQPPPDARRPPLLGEHTNEILTEWLSMTEAEISVLADKGAFGKSAAGIKESV
jgi:formyl-CoA transferase